ncbi:MAG: trypsin-like peptidase domain-containing protein [Rikenellaceae bacterium]|jgi:hypothetical protein|nr:trypsin-like peptidase domain-containing protein [Rikenellaceae bacterium]
MANQIFNTVFKVTHAGGSGSCFYLKKYGLFVTNYHVVEGFRQVAVRDNDKNCYPASVMLVNPSLDVALLSVEGDFSALPDVALFNGEQTTIGQRINVAGYPFGMPFTVTEGTVSSPKQLVDNNYLIQTDAAVNPGNSGGPMFNENGEVVAITVSKFTNADNMGFGIPVASLKKALEQVGNIESGKFAVQCPSCEELIFDREEYCPSCGEKLAEDTFHEYQLTGLAAWCEEAIGAMGIDPVLARAGNESWNFHRGSAEIRMFVWNRNYLFATSPICMLPKKELEPVLAYLLGNNVAPYRFGLDGSQIYLFYRTHMSDAMGEFSDQVKTNFTNLALRADELDNYLVENFGCEFSEYSKKE